MSGIFNYNSPFVQFICKVADCILLSLMWIVSSLPVFTMGAASTALYYTVNKVILREEGTIWKEYWHCFRMNFKQATLSFLILILAMVFVAFDVLGLYQMAAGGENISIFSIIILILCVLLVMWFHYILPYISHFYDTTKTVFKNTLLLCISNFKRSLLLLILFVVVTFLLFATQYFPVLILLLILFLPSGYALMCASILNKVFDKYITAQTDC